MRRNFLLFGIGLVLAGAAGEDALYVGWREASGTNVAENASVTFDGRLGVGEGGVFYKLGAGTLTLPLSQVDRQAPYAVTALEGTLSLAAGNATADATPPAFISDKAAFWVDATPGKGLQTEPDAEDATVTRVTRWCDVREADPSARSYTSALPAHGVTGCANEQTGNPVVTNVDGNATVYFGGLGSGQYMAFKNPSDAAQSYTKVFHFFLVHGIASTWGPVYGYSQNVAQGGFRANSDSLTDYTSLSAGHFDLFRGDQHGGLWTSRFSLNGQVVDAFRTPPRKGFQLLAGTVGDQFQYINNFFRQRSEVKVIGGDFLSEAILFTNQLSEAEFVAVERYLMAKWKLRSGTDKLVRLETDVGRIGVAEGAEVTVAPAADESVGPIAFAGEGTVTKSGAGMLVIGPSGDRPPFAGTFNLAQGTVAVRGGMAPALGVAGGDVLDASYTTSPSVNLSTLLSRDRKDGTDITLTSGGDATAVRKTGVAEARVSAISNGVKRLSVEGGSLVLVAPEKTSLYLPGNGVESVNVSVTNADFEAFFEDGHSGEMTSFSGFSHGWTSSGCRWLSVKNSNWSTYCKANIPPPSGEGVLLLKASNASAYTFVDLPVDGTYEFSCVSTIRRNQADGNYYPMGIWVGTGNNLSSSTQVGSLLSGPTPWPRTRCRFTATAGRHVIGFKISNDPYRDDAHLIDDVRLQLVRETPAPVAFTVPNGDFEKYVTSTPHYLCLNAATLAQGWTLDSSQSVLFNTSKNPAVSLSSPLSFADSASTKPTRMSACADYVYGSTHLAFIGANGVASTTFTAPAGTFRLKGRLAAWGSNIYSYSANAEHGATGNPVIEAVLTRADETAVSLGTVTVSSHLFSDVVWSVPFELDASETVTLTLKQTNSGCGLLDDLVFVDAAAADAGELVVNGSFENGDVGLTARVGSFGVAKSSRISYAGSPQYFGYNAYDGDYDFVLGNNSSCSWQINVPAEGLYRLRFAAHSRTDGRPSYACNPLRATLSVSGGSETELVFVKPFGLNFYEYSALFNVPAAGTYTLKISGTAMDADYRDRRSYIDGVSVRKVVGTVADVPSVPEKMRISVAEGARLQLDFPGTVKTGPVTLGGVVHVGTISAATCPDYISGMGTLEATSDGTMVLFR